LRKGGEGKYQKEKVKDEPSSNIANEKEKSKGKEEQYSNTHTRYSMF